MLQRRISVDVRVILGIVDRKAAKAIRKRLG
jgi:hypothetical protein